MNELTIGILALVALFALVLSGMYVAVALFVSSIAAMFLLTSTEIGGALLTQTVGSAINSLAFAVIPLFMLMGAFMTNSRGAADLYALMSFFVRKIKGGLAVATVGANAAFASVTGVSIASAVVFTRISYPQMRKHGYSSSLAIGSIAGSSVLGMLIPPSVLMILFGILTQVSIGDLFLAGIIPGLVLTTMYCVMIVARVYLHPELAGGATRVDTRESIDAQGMGDPGARTATRTLDGGRNDLSGELPAETIEVPENEPFFKLLVNAGPGGLLFVLIIGGIWGGVFTPTEAGAAGAFGALVIGMLTGMRWDGFIRSLRETALSAGAILLLLVAAQMYARMLSLSGLVSALGDTILGWALPATLLVALMALVCLLLGAVLDSTSILLLLVPLFFPITQQLGVDPIWFGIIVIVAVEVGLITPPFGMVAFAMAGVLGRDVGVEKIFRAALPFVAVMLLFLVVLFLFPALATWLPSLGK